MFIVHVVQQFHPGVGRLETAAVTAQFFRDTIPLLIGTFARKRQCPPDIGAMIDYLPAPRLRAAPPQRTADGRCWGFVPRTDL